MANNLTQSINISNFIRYYCILPGYAIKAKARHGIAIFDHWLIYLGYRPFRDSNGDVRNQHVFAVNMSPKAQFIGEQKATELLNQYFPTEVHQCYLSQSCDPNVTASRAIDLIHWNREEYNLWSNNCQDFVNQATTGQKGSYQRETIQQVATGVGVGLGIFGLVILAVEVIENLTSKKR